MAKRKAGLHKEIASIFDGVPISKDKVDGTQRPIEASAPQRPIPVPQQSMIPNYDGAVSTTKPQQPMTPDHSAASTPQSQQPQQPLPVPPKPPVSEQLKDKDDIVVEETYRQSQWQQTWEQIKDKLFTPKPGVSPTKQKAMVVLVPVLSIVLIFVLSRILSTPVRGTNTVQAAGTISATGPTTNVDWQIPDSYPTSLRDPMRFGSMSVEQNETDRPVVKGIIYSEYGSSAVIGDQIVKEGEKILGATVIKITKDSVEFEMEGKKWTQKVQ